MDKICDNCIYCYKPISVKDYFDKTFTPPDITKWGIDVFKHFFWLCGSPNVSKTDFTNNTLIYKPCITVNKRGVCEHFRIAEAEDIIPSSIEIASAEVLPEKIRTGTEITLEATITPANIPAVTKEVIVEREVPITDSEGNPLYDSNNDPITEIKEFTETEIVEPEHENTQDIKYSYQWYKNGRKLFKETNSTIIVDTSTDETAVYFCELLQDIKKNGDGGIKHASVFSNEIILDIVAPTVNKIILTVKTGFADVILPLPFKISDYTFPITDSWVEDWQFISASETKEDLEFNIELFEDVNQIECSPGITVNENLTFTATEENIDGTITINWETLD